MSLGLVLLSLPILGRWKSNKAWWDTKIKDNPTEYQTYRVSLENSAEQYIEFLSFSQIGAAYQMSSVAIYVVDLKRVEPLLSSAAR